jgi:N,N'-diacetyllegionaminate synthase
MNRTTICAELASNHGGDPAMRRIMIQAAADAGAGVVKFQSYSVSHLSPADPQYGWLKQAELSDADHVAALRECKAAGVRFLTTVFHEDRVPFLAGLGLDAIKIGSGEAMRLPLLEAVAAYPWHVYVSTGLATADELDRVVAIMQNGDPPRLTLMHTVSEYPTQLGRVNMARIAWLHERFGVPVGYSDHTDGIYAPCVALALGVPMLEIHLSRPSWPRCQAWDRSPQMLQTIAEYRDMVGAMMRLHPMCRDARERPYVGRWNWEGGKVA